MESSCGRHLSWVDQEQWKKFWLIVWDKNCNEAISSVGGNVGDTKELQEIVFVKLRLEFLVYWVQLKYLTHAHNKSLCLGEHVKLI